MPRRLKAFGGAYKGSEGPPLPYNLPNTDSALGGNRAITPYLQGPAKSPQPNEVGQLLDVSAERVRQLQEVALRRLKMPKSRSRLQAFVQV